MRPTRILFPDEEYRLGKLLDLVGCKGTKVDPNNIVRRFMPFDLGNAQLFFEEQRNGLWKLDSVKMTVNVFKGED